MINRYQYMENGNLKWSRWQDITNSQPYDGSGIEDKEGYTSIYINNNVYQTQYAIIKDINKNGKRTTCVYENLGTIDKIKIRSGDEEPIKWLNDYVKKLNNEQKKDNLKVIIEKNTNKLIDKNIQTSFNVGYLFL